MVFVGTDMRGMSTQDLPAVARALNEITQADEVMEVIEQGLVNHIALVRAMRTTFATQLFVDRRRATSCSSIRRRSTTTACRRARSSAPR